MGKTEVLLLEEGRWPGRGGGAEALTPCCRVSGLPPLRSSWHEGGAVLPGCWPRPCSSPWAPAAGRCCARGRLQAGGMRDGGVRPPAPGRPRNAGCLQPPGGRFPGRQLCGPLASPRPSGPCQESGPGKEAVLGRLEARRARPPFPKAPRPEAGAAQPRTTRLRRCEHPADSEDRVGSSELVNKPRRSWGRGAGGSPCPLLCPSKTRGWPTRDLGRGCRAVGVRQAGAPCDICSSEEPFTLDLRTLTARPGLLLTQGTITVKAAHLPSAPVCSHFTGGQTETDGGKGLASMGRGGVILDQDVKVQTLSCTHQHLPPGAKGPDLCLPGHLPPDLSVLPSRAEVAPLAGRARGTHLGATPRHLPRRQCCGWTRPSLYTAGAMSLLSGLEGSRWAGATPQ